MSPEDLRAIWVGLNDSEKFGVKFGLFPARVGGLSKDDCVALMGITEGPKKCRFCGHVKGTPDETDDFLRRVPV